MKIFLLLSFVVYTCQGDFILPSITLDDQTLKDCSYCDARSDRAGTRSAANALRQFMSLNHIQFVVDSGDVRVSQTYPNEKIDTGHSCKYTAEARNVRAMAAMLPGSVKLGPDGVIYIDEIQNSIAVAEIDHALSVNLDVRVWFGAKVLGHCKTYARKTCGTDGYSKGKNKVSVNLAASNVLVECIGGYQHLSFNIDAKVTNEKKTNSYSPVEVGKHSDCDLDILGIPIGSINKKIQQYANRYVQSGEKFTELRGPKLVAELERKLGASLGSTVMIKIFDEAGNPRTCSRSLFSSCVKKNCPTGFSRIGETDECQKYFGSTKPNCAQYGPNATLYTKSVSGITMYWCHAPMV